MGSGSQNVQTAREAGLALRDPNLFKTAPFVNGEWRNDVKKTYNIVNPANEKVLAQVGNSNRDLVREAIKAADAIQTEWGRTLASQRADYLNRLYALMMENREDLAAIITAECGKPKKEALNEVQYGADFIKWFAEEAPRTYGHTIPTIAHGRRMMTIVQPIGVSSLLTPWNFPMAMITRKLGAAIAAGCTCIVKPAHWTPLTALAICELVSRARFPRGVINCVPCSPDLVEEVGAELTGNPLVRKVAFTGSTTVGKNLMKNASETVKEVSLELGGNAPFIVFDDADIEAAVEGCMQSKFRNSGQTCVCTNRIFVHERVYDDFVQRLRKRIEALKVGDGSQDGVDQGPLISKEALEKVEAHVRDDVQHGAKLLTGGRRMDMKGYFFQPTLLVDCNKTCKSYSEEVFGPIACVFKFRNEEEVIQFANDTLYGLAGYCYTRDLARAFRMSEWLQCGLVGINAGVISTPNAPFGGVKLSGFGREGGSTGIHEYLIEKYITVGGLNEPPPHL